MQELPFSYYDDRPHGKIQVRVVNYVNSLSDLLSNGIINTITDMCNLICTAVTVAEVVENRCIFTLAHKGLRDPDSVDALCDIGSEVGLLVALNLPRAPLALLDENNDARSTHSPPFTTHCSLPSLT